MSQITWYPCKFKGCDSSVAVTSTSKLQYCLQHKHSLCYRCGTQAVKKCGCADARYFCKYCICTRCGDNDE